VSTTSCALPPSPTSLLSLTHSLQERDRTIAQLQQALDAARRRCSLLEGQIASASLTGGNVIVAGKVCTCWSWHSHGFAFTCKKLLTGVLPCSLAELAIPIPVPPSSSSFMHAHACT
jgi:hypothetical protein